MLHVTACSDRAAVEMVLPLHAAQNFYSRHTPCSFAPYPCRSVGRSGSGCGAATAAASAAAADVMAATRRPCPARAHVRSGDHELACLAQASADRSQQGPPASAGTSRQLAVTPGWLSACLHPATGETELHFVDARMQPSAHLSLVRSLRDTFLAACAESLRWRLSWLVRAVGLYGFLM